MDEELSWVRFQAICARVVELHRDGLRLIQLVVGWW